MEHQPSDHICVLKVDVTCCSGCRFKLEKALLKLNDVYSVEYDAINKLATVRCNCEPSVLVNYIRKMGKAAQLVSYSKGPTKSPASSPDHCNGKIKADNNKSCKSKAKEKQKSSAPSDEHEQENGCVRRSRRSKEKKHVCAPPPPVDEDICQDEFCAIHRRSVRDMFGSVFWNQSGRIGGIRGSNFGAPLHSYYPPSSQHFYPPPQQSYLPPHQSYLLPRQQSYPSLHRSYPSPQQSYGYYSPSGVMPLRGNGYYPAYNLRGVPGRDENPAEDCRTQ